MLHRIKLPLRVALISMLLPSAAIRAVVCIELVLPLDRYRHAAAVGQTTHLLTEPLPPVRTDPAILASFSRFICMQAKHSLDQIAAIARKNMHPSPSGWTYQHRTPRTLAKLRAARQR